MNKFPLLVLATVLALGCDDATSSVPDSDAQILDAGPDDLGQADATNDLGGDMKNPFADSIFFSDQFLNIAHRGGGLLAPEETIVAYQNAVTIGADVIECDVHATSDGVVVCMHDSSVSRTTDGIGAIRGMTLAEVKDLDAGYNFTADGGTTFPFRGQGVQIPTLDELFDAFPTTHIAIEIKQDDPPIVDAVAEAIDRHDAASRVMVAAFSDATLNAFRVAQPEIITSFALGEMLAFSRLTDATETDYIAKGQIIQAPMEQTTTENIARAHRLGLKIQVWTVNKRSEMERFMALDVDGIFTDDPALLMEILAN
jgi:glycerophosphoryl diester phosphodiesterase